MLVHQVMSSTPLCCAPSDTIATAAALMRDHDCGVVPVIENGKLAGIITDRDITCRVVAGGGLAETPVRDAMTANVFTVRDDDDVQTAIDTMEARQVRRLPVLNDRGEVTGIVAPSDLAPIFASTNVSDFLLAVSYWSRRPAPAHVS